MSMSMPLDDIEKFQKRDLTFVRVQPSSINILSQDTYDVFAAALGSVDTLKSELDSLFQRIVAIEHRMDVTLAERESIHTIVERERRLQIDAQYTLLEKYDKIEQLIIVQPAGDMAEPIGYALVDILSAVHAFVQNIKVCDKFVRNMDDLETTVQFFVATIDVFADHASDFHNFAPTEKMYAELSDIACTIVDDMCNIEKVLTFHRASHHAMSSEYSLTRYNRNITDSIAAAARAMETMAEFVNSSF